MTRPQFHSAVAQEGEATYNGPRCSVNLPAWLYHKHMGIMHLYNTLTATTEPFTLTDDVVSVYVCGITPYDTTHLGHAFTYTIFDVLIRYLEYRGYTVRYVQNVTDIDDDILRKARELGDDWQTLGNRWTAHFIADLKAINVRPPDFYPRATDVIPEIIESVAALLQAGVAYESHGNVYFHIDSWPRFGQLSHLGRDEMLPIANQRGNFPDDPHKRDPLDFVLWQGQKPDEPAWDSPWGPGRPAGISNAPPCPRNSSARR